MRGFRHRCVFVRRGSPLADLSDLIGRPIGLNEWGGDWPHLDTRRRSRAGDRPDRCPLVRRPALPEHGANARYVVPVIRRDDPGRRDGRSVRRRAEPGDDRVVLRRTVCPRCLSLPQSTLSQCSPSGRGRGSMDPLSGGAVLFGAGGSSREGHNDDADCTTNGHGQQLRGAST